MPKDLHNEPPEGGEWVSRYEAMLQGQKPIFLDLDAYEFVIYYYIHANEPIKARTACELAMETYPFSSELLVDYAHVLATCGENSSAMDVILKAESFFPYDVDLLVLKCTLWNHDGKHQEAIALLTEVEPMVEEKEKIYHTLASTLLLMEKKEEAIFWFKKSLGHEDAHPEMIRQQQRGDFAIWRNHVANFYAQSFEHAIGRGSHDQLAQLGVHFGQPGAASSEEFRACAGEQQFVAALRGGGGFLQGLHGSKRAVVLGAGDCLLSKKFVGAFCFDAGEIQLRDLRLPLGFHGGDLFLARAGFEFGELGGERVAAGAEFGRFEFNDGLTRRECVTFLREQLHDASAGAWGDAGFIHFDGAGDGVADVRFARGAERSHNNNADEEEDLGLHDGRG